MKGKGNEYTVGTSDVGYVLGPRNVGVNTRWNGSQAGEGHDHYKYSGNEEEW